MQAVDMVTWLPDDLLTKCDRMMMSFALEGRVPYLDHRVVEFGLALKDGTKVGQGVGKLFLRRWGQRFLPGSQLWSRKKGFTVPIQACLTGAVLDTLSIRLPGNEGVLRWFEPDEVRNLVRRVKAGGRGARMVWALMQFAIWHRIFIESRGQRPMANTAELSDML